MKRENLKTYTSSELYWKCTEELKVAEVYLKEEADSVIDAMESRIKELETAISNEAKWIPVYYDLPEYGKTVRVRTINSNREVKEGTASFHDGGDWGRDYWSKHGDTVGRITHWMPLPSAPTNEEK